MADNLEFKKGLSSSLANQAKDNGTVWFTTDDGKFYVDNNGTRIPVNANAANNLPFAVCNTAAGTAAKTVSYPGFVLQTGARIAIKFGATNSVANPTLNVNGTGAKAIQYRGAAIPAGYLATNRVYEFVYDGTYYQFIGDINTDTNTQLRVYRQDGTSYNGDYPLIASRTKAADLGTVGTEGSSEGVYGLISDTNANIPTTNPVTGELKAKQFTGALKGNATSADKVNHTFTLTNNGTTTVGTFNGSANESVDIAGTGLITVTGTDGKLTIATSATNNKGTVTSVGVSAGAGLTGGGTVTTSGTINLAVGAGKGIIVEDNAVKVKLKSETAYGSDSKQAAETIDRFYPVGLDKSGNLAVIVPWEDHQYTVNNATITIGPGAGLVTGGSFTTNQKDNKTITLDVGAGIGLAVTADAVKAKLKSEVPLTLDAAAPEQSEGKIYPVVTDKSGYLAVSVPWTDHQYTIGEGTLTVKGSNGITGSGTFKANQDTDSTITLSLSPSGVTAGSYGVSTAATLAHGGKFKIPYVTVDSYGRVTGIKNVELTLPAQYSLPTATASTLGGVKIGSNISVSSGTISLTQANVISALGYTPPQTDTNTTYSAGTGLSLSGTIFNHKNSVSAKTTATQGDYKGDYDGTFKITEPLYDSQGHITGVATATITMPPKQTIPTTLPNPQALKVGSKSYNGSSAVTITASDLGLASAMKFLGTTDTQIVDGSKTNPVILSGTTVTVSAGNVVLYGNKEFVWTSAGAWEELGNEGSYKVTQAAVASPSASGSATAFIDIITQDANGKITATKKDVPVMGAATASAAGSSGLVPTPTAGQQNRFLRGDATWQAISHSTVGASSSGHTHKVTHTPAGSVSSAFTGSSVNSGSPSATTAVATSSHGHTFTPSGTISTPKFTGSQVSSATPSATTIIYQIASVGSLPSLSGTVSNRCLTLSWSAGSTPTRSQIAVPTSTHIHTVTASGTVSAPTFTGTTDTTGAPNGTITVASSGHVHAVTAKGSVSSSFSGTAATLTTTTPQ